MKKAIAVVWLVVAALAVLNLTCQTGPEPDVIFPMANQHIEWHYAGK